MIRLGVVKACILGMTILIPVMATTACHGRATDPIQHVPDKTPGPIFNRIITSSKSFSIDCVPTSITVTASISDAAGLKHVVLHSRVGTDQAYSTMDMNAAGNEYQATVKAADMPGNGHGIWEFYITAEDLPGHQSQSPLDRSVEMLLCVSQ